MIAIGMNGEALPREHGFPARMVVPGLYGFISATKWLTRLTLTTYDEQEAYWTERDWATDAPIKISSRIDTPKPLSTDRRRRHRHRRRRLGPAPGGIDKVEVQHRRRRLAAGRRSARRGGDDYWRQWYLPLGRRARPAHARGPRDHRRRRDPDRRARDAVPRRLQRHPGRRRHASAENFFAPVPIRLGPRHRTTPARHHYGRSQTMKRSSPPPRPAASPPWRSRSRSASPPAVATTTPSPPPPRPSTSATRRASPPRSEPMADDAGAETFGPGCSADPHHG